MKPLFNDRQQAGEMLAKALRRYANRRNVIVLALPRGGVPVAYEIARRLNVRLDVFIVRKLGVPSYPELAMGAIASGGVRVLNQGVIEELALSKADIERVEHVEREELRRREQRYRGQRAMPKLAHQTVILVDDGVATGATMSVAIKALRHQDVAKIVVAIPLAAKDSVGKLQQRVDDFICLYRPEPFYAIGSWYKDFNQVSDDEVIRLLQFRPTKISQ